MHIQRGVAIYTLAQHPRRTHSPHSDPTALATMAKSSDAPATKCELVLSYQLDSAQALRAAKALTAHNKSSESTKAAASTKKNLLEDESSEDDDVAADG
ncbi:proteasome-interacting protein cic1 [Diplodia seriata]|uniref:Proteasome-interacting protein cic1 n=1 Tax=Diplodia seriata TaxID=420778 RepID=A0ABR3CSQ1_9PEZI